MVKCAEVTTSGPVGVFLVASVNCAVEGDGATDDGASEEISGTEAAGVDSATDCFGVVNVEGAAEYDETVPVGVCLPDVEEPVARDAGVLSSPDPDPVAVEAASDDCAVEETSSVKDADVGSIGF